MAQNILRTLIVRNSWKNGIVHCSKLYSTQQRTASKFIEHEDVVSGKHSSGSGPPQSRSPRGDDESLSSKRYRLNDNGDEEGDSSSGKAGGDDKDDTSSKSEILVAALKHVNTKGWTMNAIRAGAEEVYSSGEIAEIFNEYDLVEYFISSCNYDLENHLANKPPNLHQALEYRLGKIVPYAPKFSELLAHTTHPANVAHSVELLLKLSDTIAHYSLKDTSTNLSWYTKRLGIASIYASSELCFAQDNSPNYLNTFQFLKRRVYEFEQFKLETGTFPLPDILSAGFTTLMNILGRNAPR